MAKPEAIRSITDWTDALTKAVRTRDIALASLLREKARAWVSFYSSPAQHGSLVRLADAVVDLLGGDGDE